MISDLHGFNLKTIIIIAEYLKNPHLKQLGIVHSYVYVDKYIIVDWLVNKFDTLEELVNSLNR